MKKSLFYLTAVVVLTVTSISCTPESFTLPIGVTLSHFSARMIPGETLMLIPDITPDEASIKTVSWSSSNTDVATVTDGVVTAIAEGAAFVTVTTNSGQKSAICSLTVAYPVSGVTLDKTMSILYIGESMRLIARVLPEDAPDKSLKWESSASSVAEVKDDGTVIAKASGTAIITAITEVGYRIATCTVKVPPSENYIAIILQQPYQGGNVYIYLGGSGTAGIDWGDGSAIETKTLSSGGSSYSHNYSDTLPRIIIITGENITHLSTSYLGKLASLDVSANTALIELNCSNSQLTSLDVSANTALTNLNCSYNRLISLDVSKNIALTTLDCSNNQLTELDVSGNTALTSLSFQGNQLITLNVSNTKLRSLNVNNHSRLENFVARNNTDLTILNCSNNSLLTNLDVSANTALTTLNCNNNLLTSLDVSNNTALTTLNCSYNQLINLDVSANTALTTLNCNNNLLTSLDVNTNTALTTLYCNNNQLSIKALDDLFGTLPVVKEGLLEFLNNHGTVACDASIAENKGWTLPMHKLMLLTLQGSGTATIELAGSGTIVIDWGDGTVTSYELPFWGIYYYNVSFSHTYNDITSRTITIIGGNISRLYCYNNRLTSLEVSKNTVLTDLFCGNNQLINLDLSKNTALTTLDFSNNQLTSLDVSANTVLTQIDCINNKFEAAALNALFGTLHSNFGTKWIFIDNNPGTNSCDRSIATNKGWRFNW